MLLIGGGHAHAVALRQLAKHPTALGIRLSLISPSTHNLYSGALPGVIAGHWPAEAIGVPLQPLCDAAGVQFIQGKIIALDTDARTVTLETGAKIAFDLASLDIGSGIRPLDVPGSDDNVIAIRPIAPFLQYWKSNLSRIKDGSVPPSVIVIGAGLAGIEVALAIHYRLRREGISSPHVRLVDTAEDIAGSSAPALRRRLAEALRQAGIVLNLQTQINSVRSGSLTISTGETMDAAIIVNCAGSAPHRWVGETGLKTVHGRIEVDASLQSTSHPYIWAAGDTSHFKPEPLAPAGVFAVRAGTVIGENIRRYAANTLLSEYHPQSDYLKLVSLGGRRAVAEKFGLTLRGGWVWRLKKYIDFSFLREHSLSPGD